MPLPYADSLLGGKHAVPTAVGEKQEPTPSLPNAPNGGLNSCSFWDFSGGWDGGTSPDPGLKLLLPGIL